MVRRRPGDDLKSWRPPKPRGNLQMVDVFRAHIVDVTQFVDDRRDHRR